MEIRLPASKSISARALIINALAEHPCELRNLSDCDDTKALLQVLHGGGNIGAAGTAMRFATALLAATPGAKRILTGTPRMMERPIGVLVDALRQLGADIKYLRQEGYPPIQIQGKQLQGGTITLPAHISSQYTSALMMIGPTLQQGLTLCLEGTIASRPYIEMTRCLMAEWGVRAEWQATHTLYIPACAYTREKAYTIETDWSAASYFLAAKRDLKLEGLCESSIQGDSIIVEYLHKMDEATALGETLHLDFAACPDIAQTMTVAACLAGCSFCFTGLDSLRIKETDRIAALQAECRKFGWTLTQPSSGSLAYTSSSDSSSGGKADRMSLRINTYQDHRMAMAFALCLLRWPGITFDDPAVVTKSFPNFWTEFNKLV